MRKNVCKTYTSTTEANEAAFKAANQAYQKALEELPTYLTDAIGRVLTAADDWRKADAVTFADACIAYRKALDELPTHLMDAIGEVLTKAADYRKAEANLNG